MDPVRTKHPSWREYRFVLLLSLLALILTTAPYVLAASMATEERIFGGFVYGVEDGYSYLAKMRQGARGAWLFHLPYTPEPHGGSLFYVFYLLLGKVAALLPWGGLTARVVWAFHTTRWLFGIAFLLTVYHFVAFFADRVAIRRLAWLLITFGGGLGWLLIVVGHPRWLGSLPLDVILPEGFAFLALYGLPHILLGEALLLGGVVCLLKSWGVIDSSVPRGSRQALGLLAGGLWLAMGLLVPFYVAVAWAVAGAGWILLSLRGGRWMWAEALSMIWAALVASPIVVYSIWRVSTDPIYARWMRQTLASSPHPLHYLVAYAPLLIPAAFGARLAWRDRAHPAWFALAWVGIVPVLVYLPFSGQRRLIVGAQVPLSLLAAWGLRRFFDRLALSGIPRKLLIGLIAIIFLLTNGLLLGQSGVALGDRPGPIFRCADEVAAMDWLAGRLAADDVVLAAYATGNYLPARVRARTFVGHGPETIDLREKRALVDRFFDDATSDAWRKEMVRTWDIDVVFWGPEERALGAFDPRMAPYLVPAYEADGYAVFFVDV